MDAITNPDFQQKHKLHDHTFFSKIICTILRSLSPKTRLNSNVTVLTIFQVQHIDDCDKLRMHCRCSDLTFNLVIQWSNVDFLVVDYVYLIACIKVVVALNSICIHMVSLPRNLSHAFLNNSDVFCSTKIFHISYTNNTYILTSLLYT